MAKERFLTVLVPITDADCEATVYASLADLVSSVPPTEDNANKIYKVSDGTYYRSSKDPATGLYAYNAVTDREFPSIGDPLEIYDFTYDATRMGQAPTISASNVMRYAYKDGEGNDVTLEGYWSSLCHVVFNGENFYLKKIPTSSKTNEDARYRYDLDFVAERVVLERVYLYDVAQPFVTDKPVSESATFSFYGDISELAKRINASLIRSGLATLTRKYVHYDPYYESVLPSTLIPYLTYEQWSKLNVDPHSLVPDVFGTDYEWRVFKYEIYNPLHGDYNMYLMDYIYENENGVYAVSGYQCKIGKDKHGNVSSSEEKLITFDKNTIYEALQQFHDTFELDYYIVREKDSEGAFTGNTDIMVADCEHDFADTDGDDYVRDEDGIPTTESPFDYGAENELMSKEKANKTDKIVTRITGVGSTENIPWHYPNPTPDGWIRPVFFRKGVEMPAVDIDYPASEGDTVADAVRYEKFLKNRIGNSIFHGMMVGNRYETEYVPRNTKMMNVGNLHMFNVIYSLGTYDVVDAQMTVEMSYPPSGNCERFTAKLMRNSWTDAVAEYDSSETYVSPTSFQTMMSNRDGNDSIVLQANRDYRLQLTFYISELPTSSRFDYEGYHYPAATIEYQAPSGAIVLGNKYAHVGENFYDFDGLQPFATWTVSVSQQQGVWTYRVYPKEVGYSTNGEESGAVAPIPRVEGKKYKDVSSGTIYRCETSAANSPSTGEPSEAFTEGPTMGWQEWIQTFLTLRIGLFTDAGWYIGSKEIGLDDYGLGRPTEGGTHIELGIFDEIRFKRVKWLTAQPTLMPEVYVKTDGERRFYNAHNYYPLQEGTADDAIGEEQVGSAVRNNIYKEEETDGDSEHYAFENEYVQSLPHEHIETMDDVKPTIKGQTNTFEGDVIRIDVVEEFAYDDTDNDEIWETNQDGNISGDYKHPYFFAKLRPMGFNIFDLALQDDMVLSMTTGRCGACNFKIGVDENTKKNPVQLWEYDVYEGDGVSDMTLRYHAGDLRRYVDTTDLFYDTEDGYVPVDKGYAESGGFLVTTKDFSRMVKSYTFSSEDVANGYVGSVNKGGNLHFEGDVVTSGRFIDSQQDTSENYVWVALMKDTDSYGTLMPSAIPNYVDPTMNLYIEPKGIKYINRSNGEQSTLTEDEADKFVLTNIRLPQVYLRRAERELSRRLVKYMYDNNYQKFNFSIKFSSIFLAQNDAVDGLLNENSVLYVLFNNATYRQYVKHYTYTMRHDQALPEISVDLNEELGVSRTMTQQQAYYKAEDNNRMMSYFGALIQQTQERIGKRTLSKTDDAIVSGNIVVRDTGTSLADIGKASSMDQTLIEELDTKVDYVINNMQSLEWDEV